MHGNANSVLRILRAATLLIALVGVGMAAAAEGARPPAWPMFNGPFGNFVPRDYGADLVDDLGEARLLWVSEEHDIGVAKGHLGFEGPRGWTRRAVERTAPTAPLLYSLSVLWFVQDGHRHLSFPHRPWYRRKRRAAFADLLTTLRRQSLRQRFSETPAWDQGSRKSLQSLPDLCSRAA